jgi:hypothetical protein
VPESILVRFGTKQRRRFKFARPALAPQLKEIGALIGELGVEAEYGAHVLTRLGEGVISLVGRPGRRSSPPQRLARALARRSHSKPSASSGPTARSRAPTPDHVKTKRSASKDAERLAVLNKTIGRVPC